MVGPVIQSELWDILLRFRLHRFVFSADLSKMYRQVKIHEEDQDLQRILWRENASLPVQAYRLTTVTYGTAPASFLATRCLKQLMIEEGPRYPAAASLFDSFYMDDVMTGDHFLTRLLEKQRDLIRMLNQAGFQLHKWAANHRALIDAAEAEDENLVRPIQMNDSIKTLGMLWNTRQDYFHFNVKLTEKPANTKREVLSEISKLFDPLGLVGPVIVIAKQLMRRLWEDNLEWDAVIPVDVQLKWTEYRSSLPALDDCKVNRWLSYNPQIDCELHGFCDASEMAYGAVIYLRTVGPDGNACVNLICSKS